MRTFKTLIFKGGRTKVLGRYAILQKGEWYGCDTPRLYPMSCTIQGLEKQLPKVDFTKVELINVDLTTKK